MSFRNRIDSWGLGARVLHWSMAALFVLQWLAGEFDDFFGGRAFHIQLGLVLVMLAALRIFWRIVNPTPALPESTPFIERLASKATNLGWYLLMFVLPATGIACVQAKGKVASVLGLWVIPTFVEADKARAHDLGEIHESLAIGMLILLVLHVLAAYKHHFIAKDGILLRMLRG